MSGITATQNAADATGPVDEDQNLDTETATTTVEDPAPTTDHDEPTAGEESLGDPGKKALAAMKAERNEARRLAKERETELAALKAQAEGREAEHAAQLEAERVRAEALDAANARIRKTEVRLAAKGVLADPADALRFIDLDQIEVDEDGAIDEAAVTAAINDLVQSKPYLAAQSANRFQGSADQGHRNDAPVAQVTKSQLEKMTPEQINQARRDGRLNDLLNLKN